MGEVVQDIRKWRLEQLRSILQRAHADGRLRVPLTDAVNIAYLDTAYSTYAGLTTDIGGPAAKARALTRKLLERSLLGD